MREFLARGKFTRKNFRINLSWKEGPREKHWEKLVFIVLAAVVVTVVVVVVVNVVAEAERDKRGQSVDQSCAIFTLLDVNNKQGEYWLT